MRDGDGGLVPESEEGPELPGLPERFGDALLSLDGDCPLRGGSSNTVVVSGELEFPPCLTEDSSVAREMRGVFAEIPASVGMKLGIGSEGMCVLRSLEEEGEGS